MLNEKDRIYKRFINDNLLNNIQEFYLKEINEKESSTFNNTETLNPENEEKDNIKKEEVDLSLKPIFFGDVKKYLKNI